MTMKARPLQTGIIYGPVSSRRLGRSLGVNLLPTERKVCTFDCLYCQYGWTSRHSDREALEKLDLPSVEQVAAELEPALAAAGNLEAITLAGNGEPTLHPQFEKIARTAAGLRDRLRPGVPVCILSNSSTLGTASVREGLKFVDRKVMKLDAGSQEIFTMVNRPAAGLQLKTVAGHLAAMAGVEIQSLFFDGSPTNADEASLACWLKLLEKIEPSAVQIYSLDRIPAEPALRTVERLRLEQIAGAVRERLPEADVQVFYSS